MKLEHKRQKVSSLPTFAARLGKYALWSLLLVLFSLAVGMTGYHYLAHLNWMDSFHMSCMILTGMGPVEAMMSDSGKMFSSLYALYSGLAFLSISALFLAPVFHRILHILHVEPET